MIELGSGVFLVQMYFMGQRPGNLRPCDFYLRGSVKAKVHKTNADTLKN